MVRQLTEAEVRRWRPAGLVIFSVVLAVLSHGGWLRGQTGEAEEAAVEKPLTAPAVEAPATPEQAQPAPPSLPEAAPAASGKTEVPVAPAPDAPAEDSGAAEAETAPAPSESGGYYETSSIVITPRQKYPPHSPYAVPAAGGGYAVPNGHQVDCECEVPANCPQCGPKIRLAAYRQAYDAIPFSRAEYDANPSYRHEAAMELLFGQLRPTTIHKVQPPGPPQTAALSSAPQLLQPAPFRHYRFGYYRRGYGVYYRWPSWRLR